MEIVLLLARVLLAIIFAVAGIAKMTDQKGTQQAMSEFGVPNSLIRPLSWVLPIAELLIAFALIPLMTAWLGSLAALGLLLVFLIVVGINLARGNTPDCHCFGQLYSEPVSWSVFVRNAMLVIVAGFVAVMGKEHLGLSALAWLLELTIAEKVNLLVSLVGIGVLTFACILLKRVRMEQAALIEQVNAIKNSLDEEFDLLPIEQKKIAPVTEGLPIKALAPKFSLTTLKGDKVTLDDLLENGKPILLFFVSPNCWGCKILLPAIRAWEKEYGDQITMVTFTKGSLKENQDTLEKHEISCLLLDADSKVAEKYTAMWTPASVLVDEQGKIASYISYGDTKIREFVRGLASTNGLLSASHNNNGVYSSLPQVGLRFSVRRIGEVAPTFCLPDLSGKMVTLEDLYGHSKILLFWHPQCQFCKAMIDELRRLEEQLPKGAPDLVIIATGEMEDILAVCKAFKSLVLLDPPLDVAPLFGTKLTPSAILLDEEGRIASSLAVGDDNVRALLGLHRVSVSGRVLDSLSVS